MKRVFVTGLGAVTPIGIGINEFESGLREGRNGIGLITGFDTTNHSVKIAGEVKDFDPKLYIEGKEVRRHDRYSQFAMAASGMAIKQAGLTVGNHDPRRIGVLYSTGIGGIRTFEREYDLLLERGPSRISPFLVPMMICNIASGCIAMEHGFKGPNFCIVSACASGLHGIGEAFYKLKFGLVDAMVCGGAESAITPLTVAGFAQMKALSTRNDAPEKASRPFDADRNGFVMGEGAAGLVLETEEFMTKRGATPLAEIIGYGASADAHHLTAPEPHGAGAAMAMQEALRFAGIEPGAVDYVNAHGTSTPVGDIPEIIAIKSVFGAHAGALAVNATKSMIGHLLGAAGAVGTVATVLQMRGGFIHPTRNLDHVGEGLEGLDYVPHTARERSIHIGLVNSFGFGGQNASLLVKNI